jgi:hypothetical protein
LAHDDSAENDLAEAGRRIYYGSMIGNLGKNSTATPDAALHDQSATVRFGGNAISTRVPASGALLIRNCA